MTTSIAEDSAPVRSPAGPSTTQAGRAFESEAVTFLETKGLRIVGRNVRTKGGELDIVAFDGAQLVFVEVRSRKHSGGLDGAHSVTPQKQARVARAAAAFLQESSLLTPGFPPRCRFDVVVSSPAGPIHYRSAFVAPSRETP